MHLPIVEAKAKLSELVRRAKAGEEIVLTRHGEAEVRLVPVERKRKPTREEKIALLEQLRGAAKTRGPHDGPDAAHSADFLYDEDGLPA